MQTDVNVLRGKIEKALADEMNKQPYYDVVFGNVNFDSKSKGPFLQCLVSFSDGEYLSQTKSRTLSTANDVILNAYNRITGLVVVNIFNQPGIGTGPGMIIGNRVRKLYNRLNLDGIVFDAPSGPQVLSNPRPEAKSQTQVRVTFEFLEDF